MVLRAGSCPSPWGYPLVPLSVPFAFTLAGRRLVCRFGAPVPLHWSSARVPGWYVDDSLNFRTYLLTHARRVLRPTFAHVVLRLAGCCCRNCVATFRASSAGTRYPRPEGRSPAPAAVRLYATAYLPLRHSHAPHPGGATPPFSCAAPTSYSQLSLALCQ